MSTVRTNISLDNDLKLKATEVASTLGLSFSGLVRLLLSKTVNKNKLTGLEQGMLDYINGDVEISSGEEFLAKLRKDIDKC
ncbi:RelB antitoxin of RelBE toxin-antitoxin system [Allofrancisella inopinata]|uniref:Uncharacterized protein n=1 Tax=Allofrancisella inopinata TaxID=1085647 RepID=A0AAE6YJ58_9GAMM|nr:type II toxin-antitoxin system RelB/DinJ family antitoxin [Allofrancisella inopinata]QIV96491.1 hypothetical protein E4K63_06465 [Allofrancisella inopinata]TDT68517.1 RelB antitoxin of RelBE toxin-antitoxin system [Allofrancisella inopinata]